MPAHSKTATTLLKMLSSSSSSSSSPIRNPNPKFLSAIITAAFSGNKTLTPNPSAHFSNPTILPQMNSKSTQYLLSSAPKPLNVMPSSAMEISAVPEAREFGQETDGSDSVLVVVSFYRFADFPDHAEMRKPLKELCEQVRISGGIILAPEGINGSICGTRESVEKVLDFLQADERLKGLRLIESPVTPEDEAIHHGHTKHSPLGAGEDAPFRWDHVRVKLKKEIVSFGDPSVMPTKRVGKYVHPRDWNALISDPDTMVIDVRNTYEIRIGKFKGAVDPLTTAFREFPSWVDDQFELEEPNQQPGIATESLSNNAKEETNKLDETKKKPPCVAMYCTGGIRCEKASSFLLSKGFEEVYHLEGGILKYLEEVPKKESLWEGECFVFDKRVSVEHGLVPGSFKLCYGCKQPVSDADMESPDWEYGVSCPYCFNTKSEEEKERARARQRQFENWGVIGGPDKGRQNPSTTRNNNIRKEDKQLPNSI